MNKSYYNNKQNSNEKNKFNLSSCKLGFRTKLNCLQNEFPNQISHAENSDFFLFHELLSPVLIFNDFDNNVKDYNKTFEIEYYNIEDFLGGKYILEFDSRFITRINKPFDYPNILEIYFNKSFNIFYTLTNLKKFNKTNSISPFWDMNENQILRNWIQQLS